MIVGCYFCVNTISFSILVLLIMFFRILRDRSFVRISDEDWGELINCEINLMCETWNVHVCSGKKRVGRLSLPDQRIIFALRA